MENLVSNGIARTLKKTFSRETGISLDIQANPKTIWELLTNAPNYPNWNTTIVSINGNISKGGKIQLISKLDPKRVFKLSILDFEPEKLLSWGDALGKRVFTLLPNSKGSVNFTMIEKIGGPLFPLFAKMIPSFDASFEQFSKDLKLEAEKK